MGPGEAKPMPGPRARYHLERIRESVWDVVANGALKITYGELKKGLDESKDVSWVSPTAPDLHSQNVPPRDPDPRPPTPEPRAGTHGPGRRESPPRGNPAVPGDRRRNPRHL